MNHLERLNQQMIDFASTYGWERDDLWDMVFIVTDEGKPMIIKFSSVKARDFYKYPEILRDNYITAAIAYSGNRFIELGLSTLPTFGEEKYKRYRSNAKIKLSNLECARRIVDDCERKVTYL